MRNRRGKYLTDLNRDLDKRIADEIHKLCIQANIIPDKETKLDKE
jgi:3-hydroxyphenylacetate 6-hydroxylase